MKDLSNLPILNEMHAGKWVYGFDPELWQILLETEEKCFQLNNLSPREHEARREICKSIFGKIGDTFTLHTPFHCDFGKHIFIGDNFVGNFNLTILDEAIVTIGDNVFIGPNCSVYTINHALTPGQRNAGVMRALPVTIENNVWIGGNVVILPGVTIGEGAVIGAGSIVTGNIPPHVIAAGSPAKIKRQITKDDEISMDLIMH